MSHLKIVLCIVAVCVCYVEGNDCRPPTGGSGTCKSIYDCAPLLELVNKPNRTPQEVELLTNSKCGFQGNTPKVCCPNLCYTPEGQTGKCISIYSCPHLAKILKPPVSQENINYVQNSRCNGPDQYSVCCGPPRDNFVVPTGNCAATVSAFPPDPRTECCGVDSSVGNKIIGGTATRVDQYPWLTLIEYVKQGESQIKLLCGGALISGRYVLTAAHCVTGQILNYGRPKNVRLAEYDTNNEGEDCAVVEANGEDCTEGVVIIPIEETKAHENYNKGGRQGKNDIGLVRLARLAPWTDFIRPVCLPTMDLTITPPINFTLYAAGWGAVSETQPTSNIKLHVDLPYISRESCQPAYRAPGRNVVLGTGQICAGGQAGKDSCKGDSGGPLMYENGRIYEVIGIVSFGPKPCGLENIPGVYTKVFEYKNWIMSNIRP